ncbi:hypothetical protein DU508_15860 [Pedobacter chinensis]|uniref:Uncharacterized protein n=1 Tax=Pedobacter chinensis TaxID=2282421 RepID=A0A369PT96_9SPHI|nr:hypothetical protein [Pedobacter chinensis]RDC55744.1 hypothetical protein DU508_15860 [Pedobacter chinensis]
MKHLHFNFQSPTKGTYTITSYSETSDESYQADFEVQQNGILKVPLESLDEGQWEIVIRWEISGKQFERRRKFSVLAERNLFHANKYASACLNEKKGQLFHH